MSRALVLLVMVAVTFVLRAVPVSPQHGPLAAMLLGFTLLAGYLAGAVAVGVGLPRVTGYVLAGIGFGPFGLDILTREMVESLRTIDEIALTLIAMTAGGELKLTRIRPLLGSITAISLGIFVLVVLGIVALVLLARPLVPFLADSPIQVAVAIALLLGIWCANSSPDATMAVINETRARGPLTETILGVTIFKDVLVIVCFAAALSLAGSLVDPDAPFNAELFFEIAWEVGGAVLVGAFAGWALAFYLDFVGKRKALATLVFTYLLILAAGTMHVELLLTAVAAGFVIENFSPAGEPLIHGIEANSLLIFAIFFAVAGAALDLSALLDFWVIALVVVVVRAGLTWAGARVGARRSRTAGEVGRLVWMGLISQAGVTLGLSLLVGRAFPEWGAIFVAVTAAIIIVHLLVGPVLLDRKSVV